MNQQGDESSPIQLETLQQPLPTAADEQPHLSRPSASNFPDFDCKDIWGAPSRYLGYRVFSKWVASDPSYFIVRKFGSLNVRVILALQDEIVQLEQNLNQMDECFSKKSIRHPDPDTIHNGTFRNDEFRVRSDLISELTEKLERYNKYVNSYSQLATLASAREDDVRKVRTWLFENHRHAIDDAEAQYITFDEDLIAVQPKLRSWFRSRLRNALERTRCLRLPFIKPFFTRRPHDYDIINDGQGTWENVDRVESLSRIAIAVIGLGMLVGPLWWLAFVSRITTRLGIITGFITLFFIVVHFATTAKIFEALAGAAAYSAVLMVFMQLGQGPAQKT